MKPRILIMGLGNLLMGDEGIGIRCIEYLREQPVPEGTDLLDGGTAGFQLLSILDQYRYVILIDASTGGGIPGEVQVLRPRFAADFPRSLTSHDIGLRDLVQAAELLDDLPEIYLITVNVRQVQQVTMEISTDLEEAPRKVYEAVKKIMIDLNG